LRIILSDETQVTTLVLNNTVSASYFTFLFSCSNYKKGTAMG
jgi:hypothetical protein